MTNNRSKLPFEQELSPTQLAAMYGFERHQVAWSCKLPMKASKPLLKPAVKRQVGLDL